MTRSFYPEENNELDHLQWIVERDGMSTRQPNIEEIIEKINEIIDYVKEKK